MSEVQENPKPSSPRFLYWGAWVVAIALTAIAGYLGWQVITVRAGEGESSPASINTSVPRQGSTDVSLPELSEPEEILSIFRETNLHTEIPTRPRQDVIEHTVDTGLDILFMVS